MWIMITYKAEISDAQKTMHASHYHSKHGKNDRLKNKSFSVSFSIRLSQSYIYLVTYFICHKCRLKTLAPHMS